MSNSTLREAITQAVNTLEYYAFACGNDGRDAPAKEAIRVLRDTAHHITRSENLERIIAECYQVIGTLANDAGRFDDPHVVKALDNANAMQILHTDVLPFPPKTIDAKTPLSREQIRAICMRCGFTTKEGQSDLNEYVYDAAEALLNAAASRVDTKTPLSREQIRRIFVYHGFTVKEGEPDLKEYVYNTAEALLNAVSARNMAGRVAAIRQDLLESAIEEFVKTHRFGQLRQYIQTATPEEKKTKLPEVEAILLPYLSYTELQEWVVNDCAANKLNVFQRLTEMMWGCKAFPSYLIRGSQQLGTDVMEIGWRAAEIDIPDSIFNQVATRLDRSAADVNEKSAAIAALRSKLVDFDPHQSTGAAITRWFHVQPNVEPDILIRHMLSRYNISLREAIRIWWQS